MYHIYIISYHSSAIVRYIAKRSNLIGGNIKEELQCDMIAEATRELVMLLAMTPFKKVKKQHNEHLQTIRQKWTEIGARLEMILRFNGGQFMVGKCLSYADVLVAHCVTWLVEEV